MSRDLQDVKWKLHYHSDGGGSVTESDDGSSIVRRWQLAAALKDFREQAGLTQEQAVAQLRQAGGRWSASKLSRIENREHGVRTREVEQLLDVYSVTDGAVREPILTLAARARERAGRAGLGVDLPEHLRSVVSIEAGLVAMRQFETMLIPGLLQTTDYTRALIEVINEDSVGPTEIERRVAARMARQHVLRRPAPPTFHVILDQAVLQRPIGRPSVMRDQLRKLVDLAAEPFLTLQILPLDAGGGPGLNGPFTLISLPSPAPDIVYGEGGPPGMIFVEDRDRVRMYTLWFGKLSQQALPRSESLDLVDQAAKSYE